MSTVTGADRPCGRCGHVDDKGRPCVLSEPLHRRKEDMVWPHDFQPVESRSAQGAQDRCAFKFSDDPGAGACSTPRSVHGAMMHTFVPPSPPVANPPACTYRYPDSSACQMTRAQHDVAPIEANYAHAFAPIADSPKPLPWSGEMTPTREELRSARERVNPTPRDPEADSPKPADESGWLVRHNEFRKCLGCELCHAFAAGLKAAAALLKRRSCLCSPVSYRPCSACCDAAAILALETTNG